MEGKQTQISNSVLIVFYDKKMPRSCCVVVCTANCKKNKELKFYRIPKNGTVRRKWLNAINRAADSTSSSKLWSPKSSNVYVCSAHFITGKQHFLSFLLYILNKFQ